MTLWRGVIATLVALAALIAGLAYAGSRWVQPRREPAPADVAQVQPQEVYFPSLDGTRLHALYCQGNQEYPTLILCHGYARSLAEPWEVGLGLNSAGYNVFLLDFRACGKSGGRFTTIGYKETWDMLAAVRFVKRNYGRGPVGVFGISMGGAAAIIAAAQSPEIAAVAADSAYADLQGVLRKKVPDFTPTPWLAPLGWLSVRIGEWLSGSRLAAVRPIDYVQGIAPRPLLLIYGEEDSYVPVGQPQALFAQAGEPKQIWFAPGSDHAVARLDYPEEYMRRLQGFFDRHLLQARGQGH